MDMTTEGPFDRRLLRRRRNRAAAGFDNAAFLVEAAAGQLVDRLGDVSRRFDSALVLGCHTGLMAPMLLATGRVARVVSSDAAFAMAARAAARLDHVDIGSTRSNRSERDAGGKPVPGLPHPALVADEEALPFAAASFDLIVSPLVLQWVNDLPGALVQCRRCLRPDGLLLAAMLGGDSLRELREATLIAESEITGGAAPRVAPFAEVRELGGLLQRAGLALPVADSDRLTVRYADPFSLMRDIKAMGAANAPSGDVRRLMRRDTLVRTAEVYAERFADADGRIRATFDIVYLTGWAPHESQQQPLRPGSARTSLAEALGTVERPAGEKTGPQRR